MSSEKIEREIADLQKRREALAFDAATAQRDLEDARKGLVSGKAKAPQVTSAQSTFTALNEALSSVDAQLEELRAQLAQAHAAESEQAKAARIKELNATMSRTQSEYDSLREEAGRALAGFAERVIELRTTYANASREVGSLRGGERAWTRHEMRYSPMPPGYAQALEVAVGSLAHERDRISHERDRVSRERDRISRKSRISAPADEAA
jgi:chromosome segregation ATPase